MQFMGVCYGCNGIDGRVLVSQSVRSHFITLHNLYHLLPLSIHQVILFNFRSLQPRLAMLAAVYRQALRRDRIRRIVMAQEGVEEELIGGDGGGDYTHEAPLHTTYVNKNIIKSCVITNEALSMQIMMVLYIYYYCYNLFDVMVFKCWNKYF